MIKILITINEDGNKQEITLQHNGIKTVFDEMYVAAALLNLGGTMRTKLHEKYDMEVMCANLNVAKETPMRGFLPFSPN